MLDPSPSPREAVGRGRGWGVPRRILCQRSELIDPPPPTPPRHAQGRVGGGEFPERCSLVQDDDSFRFIFQTAARPRSRGTTSPEFCVVPRDKEGAGNAGCALHPRSRVQNVDEKTHTSIQVQRRHSGIPCAMALRFITRSPRRIGLCCLRRLRIDGASAPGRADLPFRRLDANR